MNSHEVENKIEEQLVKRANRLADILQPLAEFLPPVFYIAGGSMSKDSFNDIDLFPSGKLEWNRNLYKQKFVKVLSETKNAVTIKYGNTIIQFCNYSSSTLNSLLHTFDFSHIQVGATILNVGTTLAAEQVEFTDNFVISQTLQNSVFQGSIYPLSSLVRLLKYYKRDQISKGMAIKSIINILVSIVSRGFHNWEDFKDQLDAFDLGLVPEHIEDVSQSEIKELFNLLRKDQ